MLNGSKTPVYLRAPIKTKGLADKSNAGQELKEEKPKRDSGRVKSTELPLLERPRRHSLHKGKIRKHNSPKHNSVQI